MLKNTPLERIILIIILYIIIILLLIVLQFFEGNLKFFLSIIFNLIMGVGSYYLMKLTDMKLNADISEYKQYIIGIDLCALLLLIFKIIPIAINFSFWAGQPETMGLLNLLIELLKDVLLIGTCEEMMFRFYIQDTIKELLPSYKWVCVIISSILFGFFHISFDISFYIKKAIGVSIIGLFFGGVKHYFDKDFGFFGLSLCHGLYDFFLTVINMTIL